MIDELRIYTIKAGSLPAYLEAFERLALPILSRYVQVRGYWTVDCGDLLDFYHLSSFTDHAQRQSARTTLAADPDWPEFRAAALPLVVSMRNIILLPTSFSPKSD